MKPIFLTLITSLLFLVGCEKDEENWIINSDKYVFVDHHVSRHGETIEGNYVGGLHIDFPTYSYDESSKTLGGIIDFEINKSLKVIYGDGTSISGVIGSGIAAGLTGIYDIPYANGRFEIQQIEPNGTVHIQYMDSIIVLKSNEEWVNVTTEIITQDYGEEIARANITTIDRFVNYGIIEKSKIENR